MVWKASIDFLDNLDITLRGTVRGGLLSSLGKRHGINQRISDWRDGKSDSLRGGKGVKYVAYLAEVIAKLEPRRASSLIAKYVLFASFFSKNILESALSEVEQLVSETPRNSLQWINAVLKVHLLVLIGEPAIAFAEAWRYWDISREGYDIPSEVFYTFRKAAFAAKSKLVEQRTISELVGKLSRHLRVSAEPPNFKEFEKISPISREFDLPFTESDFVREEFGVKNRKLLFYSPLVNSKLQTGGANSIRLVHKESHYSIPTSSCEFAWLAFAESISNKESDLFNGFKIRLMEILSPKTFEQEWIEFQQTDYLSTLVTNRSCHLRFRKKGTSDVLELLGEGGLLLDASMMSSQIGVMACIITSDGYLVSMYQEKTNAVSGGELVPFGGSVEFFDLEVMSNKTLGSIVEHTVRREVKEEAVIGFDSVSNVMLVGYTLDAGKGLKPDFFGLAWISKSWIDIERNREEFFGGPFEEIKLDLESPSLLKKSLIDARTMWNQLESAAFLDSNMQFLIDASDHIYDQLVESGGSGDQR